jgi:hypothetical protein
MHLLNFPEQASGISDIETGLCDVFGYHRSRSDNCAITYRHWKNGSVGADAHLVSDSGRHPIVRRRRRVTRPKTIINKHYSVRDEATVSNGDQFTDE